MNLEPLKPCTVCKGLKPYSNFYRNPAAPLGLYSKCKPCHGIATKKWRDEHKESQAAYRKIWKSENRERVNASAKARRLANIHERRKQEREKSTFNTYGITVKQKEEMLSAQGGCAACGGNEPNSKKGWHIDHCHATGKVRGILCHHCNSSLGNARDSIDRLKMLIAYLEKCGST